MAKTFTSTLVIFVLVGSYTHLEIEAQKSACRLPNGPPSRLYCPVECYRCYGGGCHLPPGTDVTQTVTRVECAPGYRLEKDDDFDLVGCTGGRWTGEFPQCLAQCPPLESDSVFVRCRFNGKEADCSRPMMPRTFATFECRRPSHVEYPDLAQAGAYSRTLTCRNNGRWSYGLPECKPVCGVSKGSAVVEATVKDGLPTKLGVFPWHAGLYHREGDGWKYSCGGSLITKHHVLTAAHCVIIDKEDLRVTFAKILRPWEQDEPDTIKRSVSAVSVPREFSSGANTLAWDIALLLLSEPVQISSNVMPVCRDVSRSLYVTPDSKGYVVGWGSTGTDRITDVLQHNDVTIKLYDVCSREIPRQLSVDKFCGSKNGAQGSPESVVQKGDSGGGLTVVHDHQHYILGIVSLKYNDISVFTNVSWFPHKHWMDTEMNNLLLDGSSENQFVNEHPKGPQQVQEQETTTSLNNAPVVSESSEKPTLNPTLRPPRPPTTTAPTSTETNNAAIRCPEPDGYFVDPEQCDKYYHCENGEATEKLCPDGMVFDGAKCKLIIHVDCSGRPKLQEPQPSLHCKRQNGNFAHEDPKVCDKYYYCQGGNFREITCKNGNIFDGIRRCTSPSEARKKECSSETEDAGFECPSNSRTLPRNGFLRYAHPEDCRRYYICIDRDYRGYKCPMGTVFKIGETDGQGGCEDPEDVPGCEDYYADSKKTTNQTQEQEHQNEDGITSFIIGGSIKPLRNETQKPDGENEEDQWITDVKPVRKSAISSLWNSLKEESENIRFKCPRYNGFFRHYVNCEKYWKCEQNKADLKACPEGQVFRDNDPSYVLEDCDYINKVDCGNRTLPRV